MRYNCTSFGITEPIDKLDDEAVAAWFEKHFKGQVVFDGFYDEMWITAQGTDTRFRYVMLSYDNKRHHKQMMMVNDRTFEQEVREAANVSL